MSNHKWDKAGECRVCGIKRKLETQSLLMAVTEQPPYNHYQHTTKYCYQQLNGAWTFLRPDCKK